MFLKNVVYFLKFVTYLLPESKRFSFYFLIQLTVVDTGPLSYSNVEYGFFPPTGSLQLVLRAADRNVEVVCLANSIFPLSYRLQKTNGIFLCSTTWQIGLSFLFWYEKSFFFLLKKDVAVSTTYRNFCYLDGFHQNRLSQREITI